MRGQTRATNSQAVAHESWLVRCSPCVPSAKAIPIISGKGLPLLTENNSQPPFYLDPPPCLLIFRLSVGSTPPLPPAPIIWNWKVCSSIIQSVLFLLFFIFWEILHHFFMIFLLCLFLSLLLFPLSSFCSFPRFNLILLLLLLLLCFLSVLLFYICIYYSCSLSSVACVLSFLSLSLCLAFFSVCLFQFI